MSVTKQSILKAILLKEFDRMQPEVSTFEDDPMQFILRKYEGLNKTLTYLMTPSFQDYITGIYIVAPKPTTFKVVLHNAQFFFLEFTGKTYEATVAGKGYYLMNIGEKERCMLAIARLLRYGNPLKTKGPEGAEQGTREGGEAESTGGEAGSEVPEATPEDGGEEPITEARILEEILKKKVIEQEEEYSGNLTVKDLAKKSKAGGFRGDIILDFIKKKTPFLMSNGVKRVLNFKNDDIKNSFIKRDYDKLKDKNLFIDQSDNEYSLNNLVKTSDFSGKIKGFSTKHETKALNELNNQIKEILSNKNISSIKVKIGDEVYDNIASAVNQSENPKADFNLLDLKGVPKVFISHKKGGGSKSFIRWGGFQFAYKEGNPEVLKFVENIKAKVPDEQFKSGNIFAQKIDDDLLKNRIVFGKDFGGKFGKNNVQIVVQGNLKLKEIEGNVYELVAENSWINGNLPTGDYEPVLEAHYRSGDFNHLGFKNCEAFARPIKTIPNTAVTFSAGKSEDTWKLDKSKKTKKQVKEIPKEQYKKIVSKETNTELVYVNRNWIKTHPEYKKDFDDSKMHPKDRNFVLLKPDSKLKFNLAV